MGSRPYTITDGGMADGRLVWPAIRGLHGAVMAVLEEGGRPSWEGVPIVGKPGTTSCTVLGMVHGAPCTTVHHSHYVLSRGDMQFWPSVGPRVGRSGRADHEVQRVAATRTDRSSEVIRSSRELRDRRTDSISSVL